MDQCLRIIEEMYQRMDEVREDILNAQRKGDTAHIQQIVEMESFLNGQKVRIERKRLEARELLIVAEAKHEALIEAAKEKKILVKLKEKRLAEYREWLRRIELKEMDDLTNMRVARRKS